MKNVLVVALLIFFSNMLLAQTTVIVRTAVAPHYPPISRAERAQETIAVAVAIGANGSVTSAVATSGLNVYLKKESEDTAKKWIFAGSDRGMDQVVLRFVYAILDGDSDVPPHVEFHPPFEIEIRQHRSKTSGPASAR